MSKHAVADREMTEKFRQAKATIEQQYRKPWRHATLASSVGISGIVLQQLFRQHLNTSTMAYLREVRVRAAGELILAGVTVTKAAELCGFKTTTALSYHFHRVTGIYASHYRFKTVGWKTSTGSAEARVCAKRASGDGERLEVTLVSS